MLIKDYDSFDKDGSDAIALGDSVMDLLQHLAIADFVPMLAQTFFRSSALRHVSVSYPWFLDFFVAVILNRLAPPGVGLGVDTLSLKDVTSVTASRLGSTFAAVLFTSVTADDAVAEYMCTSPALAELDDALPSFFKPFLSAVARRLALESDLGLRMRVAVGGGLSVADMLSDGCE